MTQLQKFFLVFLGAASILAAALQLPVIQTARNEAFDVAAASDLRTIEDELQTYVSKNDRLPASLSAVTSIKDLEKNISNYTYKPGVNTRGNDYTYQLCAKFKTDTEKKTDSRASSIGGISSYTDFAEHPKGDHCFTLSAYSYPSYYNDSRLDDDCTGLFCGLEEDAETQDREL